jgi:cystathionine beta-lyase/cystathionine gamma-synthase
MIPYGRQEITDEDIEAVISVLRSDFITQGPTVPRFEEAVAASCGAKRAVAVNSGTSALHIACRALDLGPNRAYSHHAAGGASSCYQLPPSHPPRSVPASEQERVTFPLRRSM